MKANNETKDNRGKAKLRVNLKKNGHILQS